MDDTDYSWLGDMDLANQDPYGEGNPGSELSAGELAGLGLTDEQVAAFGLTPEEKNTTFDSALPAWFSKFGNSISDQWDKDPTKVINAGLGILAALYHNKHGQNHIDVNNMNAMLASARSNPNYAANTPTPGRSPQVRPASSYIQNAPAPGPLTQIKRV